MKRTPNKRRGAHQIRTYYFWTGISYPTNVARLRRDIGASLLAIAPIFGEL